jgi:hypothetical protein
LDGDIGQERGEQGISDRNKTKKATQKTRNEREQEQLPEGNEDFHNQHRKMEICGNVLQKEKLVVQDTDGKRTFREIKIERKERIG